jgi:hypothetical protein
MAGGSHRPHFHPENDGVVALGERLLVLVAGHFDLQCTHELLDGIEGYAGQLKNWMEVFE